MTACPCAQELVADRARERLEADGFTDDEIERVFEHVPVATHNQRGIGTLLRRLPRDAAARASRPSALLADRRGGDELRDLRADEAPRRGRGGREGAPAARASWRTACARWSAWGSRSSRGFGDDAFLMARQENLETIHKHNVVAERYGLVGELLRELAGEQPTGAPRDACATGSRARPTRPIGPGASFAAPGLPGTLPMTGSDRRGRRPLMDEIRHIPLSQDAALVSPWPAPRCRSPTRPRTRPSAGCGPCACTATWAPRLQALGHRRGAAHDRRGAARRAHRHSAARQRGHGAGRAAVPRSWRCGASRARSGTVDLLFAVIELYGRLFDRALYLRGSSREELVERLAEIEYPASNNHAS